MFDIGTTKMSSKGQIVIPVEMREGFKEGDKFVLVRKDDSLVFQKVSVTKTVLAEELELARRTAKAWKEIEQGKAKKFKSPQEMLKHLRKAAQANSSRQVLRKPTQK